LNINVEQVQSDIGEMMEHLRGKPELLVQGQFPKMALKK
jgi:hypothetical protein